MKKFITIALVLCLLHTGAAAQWYLFPGARANENEREETAGEEQNLRLRPVPGAPARQETDMEIEDDFPDFGFNRRSVITVTLALPVNADSEKPSSNFLEMYGGALLALRDLGDEGVRTRLRLVDTASGNGLTAGDIENSDVIIGPVTYDEILSALPMCGDRMLISPLDPKTAELAAGSGVIQAPSSWASQVDELVDWVQEELMPEDELIVIRDPSKSGSGEQSDYLMSRLHGKVLDFRIVKAVSEINFVEGRTYRILIATDSDAFLTGAARAAAIEAARNRNIILYSTSRIRSTIGSNVNDLYDTRTRLTASYYIDYDSRKVKDFILAYRALYKGEPGSFAFQGYDTVYYFVSMCRDYGRRWQRRLPESPMRGLQSDFSFDRRKGGGRENVAVRRVVYNSDLTTSLAQY